LSGPAIGEPDPGRAAPSRTGFGDVASGILVLLALGLALRVIIAYLLPGSGFKVDISSFQYWAENLAREGLSGFYERDFFHDYTPGYLYVLWLIGGVAQLFGSGVGDLIKVPPILADLALAWLVWSMARELGASERAARIGAALVLFNPVTWLDSAIWGQVDSVGVVVLLLALRELWRDRPERAALLAMLAALVKPQLGILIPIVAVVTIRRALWPRGGYGEEPAPPSSWLSTWERTVRGPIRILTTATAGLATALAVSWPFGLSLPGLIAQIFSTAAGYPRVSVNAYNPWALVTQVQPNGVVDGIAANRQWICDSTVVPTAAFDIRIGDWVLWHVPASTLTCPDGLMIGAFPAVMVGAILFLLVAAVVVWRVALRPDRSTMLVALAALALAFFILPTRVHERYLFPLVGLGALLAGVSIRWRIAYVLSAAATFANMYAVLTTIYRDNPGISDWLGIGETLTSYWGVAIAAVTQTLVFGWVFLQLRDDALDHVAESSAEPGTGAGRAGDRRPAGSPLDRWLPLPAGSPAADAGSVAGAAIVPWESAAPAAPHVAPGAPPGTRWLPAWNQNAEGLGLGPWEWFKARFRDRPIRADRSRALARERGGRVDRLDIWILAVLAVGLLSVRLWRLAEPYQMHFDEVYHPRTATEFLQDWRYGISHEIYEWTHPHVAKYAMALGIMAWGEDRVGATSRLGGPVVEAMIEPRRDDATDRSAIKGDRLWVATGTDVRAYDLATREPVATISLPGVVALAMDRGTHVLYAGTRDGRIETIDLDPFDSARVAGGQADVVPQPSMDLGGTIEKLFMSRDSTRLAAVLGPDTASGPPAERRTVVVIDPDAASEIGRAQLNGVTQLTDDGQGGIAVGTSEGVALIDTETGTVETTFDVGGPVGGLVKTFDVPDDPIYTSVRSPTGPKVVTVVVKTDEAPRISNTIQLPGDSAGRVYFDLAARMVHVEGTVPDDATRTTVYVIEPHGNAVYADAELPFQPAAMVLDDNQLYPSTDRQQLLALDPGGVVASVEIGRHALAWRIPGVLAGVAMALLLYVLARLLFRRRAVAVLLGLIVLADGMLFAQSRIGMNDAYVGLGIVGAYVVFAALWLHPGGTRRHWLAFALGVPLIGVFLGFALASKWVAAYAIGSLGILTLARSALGRVLLIMSLILLTTVLGYVAISVPPGESGGNYLFPTIMVGLTLIAVIANVLHPIAWTVEELWFAIGVPAAAAAAAILYGLATGDLGASTKVGPIAVTPLQLAFFALVLSGAVYTAFVVVGRFGFGPLATAPPDDAVAVLEPPAAAPEGWLRLGSGFGLPAIWLLAGVVVLPLVLYVASYLPWSFVEGHQIVTGWPPGHTKQTLLDLTSAMYDYHNRLSSGHPASSPWWAWALDLKPVWFYEEGFAGSTSASIYDAGNLVAWWLSIPAMAFVAWQAFKRRSAGLALVAVAFACQWIAWSRIDRAAFQYHYYTALPFLFLALAYFLAELWHGPSRRTWLLARVSAAVAVLGPFGMWLLHRPLCAIVRVTEANPTSGSQACPTLIPDATITPRAVAIAVVVGLGVLLLVRELFALVDESEDGGPGGWTWRAMTGRLRSIVLIALGTIVAFLAVSLLLGDVELLRLDKVPVEPIALVVTLALTPVAAYIITARDARRFVLGAVGAIGFWFVLWYPNIAALPLPAAIHNAYQGFLPTYLYPFQFPVSTLDRSVSSPSLFDTGPAIMLGLITVSAIVIGYATWSWRIVLAERRQAIETSRPGDDSTGVYEGAG
jgi:Gpi18-like mannosyltransferase